MGCVLRRRMANAPICGPPGMPLASTTKDPATSIYRGCAVVKLAGSGARRFFGCSGLVAGCIRAPSLIPARACRVRASVRHITGGERCGGSCCRGRSDSRHLRRFERPHLLWACSLGPGPLGQANAKGL